MQKKCGLIFYGWRVVNSFGTHIYKQEKKRVPSCKILTQFCSTHSVLVQELSNFASIGHFYREKKEPILHASWIKKYRSWPNRIGLHFPLMVRGGMIIKVYTKIYKAFWQGNDGYYSP